jgi:DNA-binding transcriptional MerR regulator
MSILTVLRITDNIRTPGIVFLERITPVPRNEPEYTINELAKKANVSVRTIRFYINEGLLPGPQTRGRYTVYTDEYLDRLELIRRLKESFLPLKEIRATLTSLDWDDVRATLRDPRIRENAQQKKGKTGDETESIRKVAETRSSALEYIQDLLSSTPANRPIPPTSSRSYATLVDNTPTTQESWQRVILAPGLEFHIRQPIPQNDQTKIEAVIQFAKKIFSSEKI